MSTATDLQKLYADNIYNQMRYQMIEAPRAQYQIGVLGRERDRSLNDQKVRFTRQAASVTTPLTASGLENSGIAGVHMGNYFADNARAEADILASFQQARDQVLSELAQTRAMLGLDTGQTAISALGVAGAGAMGG